MLVSFLSLLSESFSPIALALPTSSHVAIVSPVAAPVAVTGAAGGNSCEVLEMRLANAWRAAVISLSCFFVSEFHLLEISICRP